MKREVKDEKQKTLHRQNKHKQRESNMELWPTEWNSEGRSSVLNMNDMMAEQAILAWIARLFQRPAKANKQFAIDKLIFRKRV